MAIIRGKFGRKKQDSLGALENRLKEKILFEETFFSNLKENCETDKGIGVMSSFYIEDKMFSNKIESYNKMYNFVMKYKQKYIEDNKLDEQDVDIIFINYGTVEFVYLLEDKKNNKAYTLLVKQPLVPFGTVKREHDNLIETNKKDKSVIAPIDYFSLDEEELYVTPYIPYARCVASYDTWGMYVPEPEYRFVNFTDEEEDIVNTCIVAKLVSMYDFEKNKGIAVCKIGSGDFMLKQGWENEELSIENTLDSLYLIALRNYVACDFEEYLDLLRKEFSISTMAYFDAVINIDDRVPMKKESIEKGIELGQSLIKK